MQSSHKTLAYEISHSYIKIVPTAGLKRHQFKEITSMSMMITHLNLDVQSYVPSDNQPSFLYIEKNRGRKKA